MGNFSENAEKRLELKKQMNELWHENLEVIKRYYERLREVGKIKEERFVRYWSVVLPPGVPDDGHMYVHVQYDIQGDGHIRNEIIKADDIDNFLKYEHTEQRFKMAEILFHNREEQEFY